MKKLITFALFLLASSALASEVRVIVHASNPTEAIGKEAVANLFLKKTTRWDNGRVVVPVDQSDKSAMRESFSREVLAKEVVWVKSYWQRMIFSGRATPPAELSSDAEVLAFVRSSPDSVGYVSASTPLTAGIKAVAVKE